MNDKIRKHAHLDKQETVENPPGIFRTTLAFNDATMVCHFTLKPGSEIPLHNHGAVQNGFVIRGKVKFNLEGSDSFVAEAGSGYVFDSYEYHGAQVIEESEIIECFSPMRPEYVNK
jgi:quercetin dioxygenase-like cupin family protein